MKIIEKALLTGIEKSVLEDLIRELFNSHIVEIDDENDVWIENPQQGHWIHENSDQKKVMRDFLVSRLNLALPRRFKVKTDNCSEIFEAEDIEAAINWAECWLEDGEYGDDPCYVSASVVEIDEDDEAIGYPEDVEIEWAGNITIPDCDHEDGHDWQEPYEVVGGCKENPGVYGIGGAQIRSTSVCSRCGMYRVHTSASTPGNYPKEPEKYEYRDANERSMEWVESLLD